MPSSQREPLDPMAALRRFRALVEQSADVIMLVGPTGELLYASLAASSVLGYAPGENLGRATCELVHPDDLAQVHALFRDLLTRSTGPTRAEFRVRHKEGAWRYLEATGINRLDEPAVEAIVVTCRDVTDRREAEDAQRAAYWIAEAVLSTYSLDELFSSIHRILGDLMPVPNLYIALYDAAGDTLTFPYFVDERESAPPPRRLNHGLTEYALRTGQPELVGPDRQRELEQRGEVDLLGAAALEWLGIPLKSGAKTIGVLVIQSYTERIRFGEREKRILQFVSAEVTVAIERRGAEESLSALEALLQARERLLARLLVEAEQLGQTGSWEQDFVSQEIFNTDANLRLFFGEDRRKGTRLEDYIEAIHPDDRDLVVRRREQLLAGTGSG